MFRTLLVHNQEQLYKLFGICDVALGSTQPLTEMSTRNTSWGVKAAGA
jgi:hypothetical protein